jgi:hypothetical protein
LECKRFSFAFHHSFTPLSSGQVILKTKPLFEKDGCEKQETPMTYTAFASRCAGNSLFSDSADHSFLLPALLPATRPLLEMQLHLTSGNTHTFTQNDPASVRQILRQVGPQIFSQPSLVLYGPSQVKAYPGSALVGLSLQLDPRLDPWLQRDASLFIHEITQEEYRAKQRTDKPVNGQKMVSLFTEAEMTSGRRLWFEVEVPPAADGFGERQMLHHVFTLPSVVCRGLHGGLSLWNRAQMVSCCFSANLHVPANAWPAEAASHGYAWNGDA